MNTNRSEFLNYNIFNLKNIYQVLVPFYFLTLQIIYQLTILNKEFISTNPKKFQTGKVFSISFAHLVHDVYSSFLAPILPLLIEKFGLNYTLASVMSIAQRAPNILNPFVGIIADKYPVRMFVILTPLITAISMSLLGIAPSYVMLCILLFCSRFKCCIFSHAQPRFWSKKFLVKASEKG